MTKEPGLIGSLLVGISFARALSAALDKPLVEIDHIKAHVYANFLTDEQPRLPAVGLIVSGDTRISTACGTSRRSGGSERRVMTPREAFDKVARVLGLGYPGGPAIDRLSKSVPETEITFKYAALEGTLDFSFSGVKTAVLYHRQKYGNNNHYPAAEVARAFQKSVVEILVIKALRACREVNVRTLFSRRRCRGQFSPAAAFIGGSQRGGDQSLFSGHGAVHGQCRDDRRVGISFSELNDGATYGTAVD